MTTQTRTIRVVVDTRNAQGLRKLSEQFGKMNRSVKSVESSLGGLGRVLRVAIAGFSVREITRSADSFQLLRDRIKVFTGDAELANDVFRDIVSLAAQTRSSVESFAEAYNRVAIATRGLGLNSDQTLGIVTALQQSLRLSGATAQEASSVFIQLSQALSLGRLQGQELRAVLLSNATVANILAKEFGVTTGQLKELGEQGRLTSDRVIKALANNFEELNTQASQLGTTFQQSVIVILDQFRLKVDELNQRFDLNNKFFKGISFLIANFEKLTQILTVLVGTGLFVKLAAQIKTLSASITASLAANGSFVKALGLTRFGIIGVGLALSFLATEALSDWERFQLRVSKGVLELRLAFAEFDTFIFDVAKKLTSFGGSFNPLNKLAQAGRLVSEVRLNKFAEELGEVNFRLSQLKRESSGDSAEDIFKRIQDSLNAFQGGALAGTTGELASLNKQFSEGALTLEQYRMEVSKVEAAKLNEQFTQGKISVDQYNDSILKLSGSFTKLSGSAQVFEGIVQGARQANQDIGSLSQEIAGVTTSAFNNLEDRLVEFVKTGKFQFKDFVQAVLDDLTRVAIRLSVIRALTQATGFGTGQAAFANGGVFRNGDVQPFQNGGVVTRPTVFPMRNGTGLMGEAGPEAILPLKRGPGGKLGVESSGGSTVVNVINNSSGNVETRESTGSNGEKQIDVIVVDRVNKAIREGKFDRTMNSTFGISRRGN